LRARLDRDVERAVGQPIGLERRERALDRQKLGVIGGIAARDGLVVRLGDNLLPAHDHSPDWNFINSGGTPGLL